METLPIKSNHHPQSVYKNGLFNFNSHNHYQIAKEKIINQSFKNEMFDSVNDQISYEVDFYGFVKKGVYFDIYI